MSRRSALTSTASVLGAILVSIALSPAASAAAPRISKAPLEACALLDDPEIRPVMDGLLLKLLLACGRDHELGQVRQEPSIAPIPGNGPGEPDVQVNDSSGDAGGASHTQSETSIAENPTTGTLCSGFNDSYHGVVEGQGFTGFARSTDDGATWVDGGPLGANSGGDPSLVWRAVDGNFYITALETSGLGIWRSTDDCQSFTFLGNTHVSGGDDKELMAVDNNPGSPFFGRLYVAWTDFSASPNIRVNYSDDGGATWTPGVGVSVPGETVQGAWPTVAPNGDLYVAWAHLGAVIDQQVVRSTDGGDSFTTVTEPLSNGTSPQDSTATSNCFRPALNGNIRYLPSPQIAVGPDGVVHIVYTYDPDGAGPDTVDVFYRRSTDDGATWGPEVRVNDDATTSDQFFATLSVGETNVVSVAFYDRRLDPSNLMADYYQAFSFDGGVTWEPNIRLTDVSTPIFIDPNLATCYHGDYDTQIQTASQAVIQWSDDRNMQDGHNDPDVWLEGVPVSDDFLVTATPRSLAVCSPADAVFDLEVLQFQGFTDPVTLSTVGEPAGTTPGFSTNPVVPTGTSILTLTDTGAAAAGSYPFDVNGTAGASSRDTAVTLDLFDIIPAAPTLDSPADAAVDVALVPTFTWTAPAQATSYSIEVADDAAFSNIVYQATGVDSTSHTIDVALDPVTEYFWRVSAGNVCGEGTFAAAFSFTTRAIPPILLVDDDDNNPDVRGTYEAALVALGQDYDVWDTANSDNEPSITEALPYEIIIWETGDEFGGVAGPGTAGEAALSDWLDGGGCLFLSSQDYHFDRGLTAFMQDYLGVTGITNDTDQNSVTGAGSRFAGLGPYTLSYPFTDFSDSITGVDASAEVGFVGDLGDAAVNKDSGTYKTVFFVYPFEALASAGEREEVLGAVLDFCGVANPNAVFSDGFESGNTSAWTVTVP